MDLRRLPWWVATLLLFSVYLAASFGLSALASVPQVPFWFPTGIAVAGVWLFGPAQSLTVVLATLVYRLLLGRPWDLASLPAVGNGLEALVTVALLHRFRFEAAFPRLRDLFALLIAAVIGPVFSALFGTLIPIRAGSDLTGPVLASYWFTWWRMNALGIAVVTPVILVWLSREVRREHRASRLEAAVYLLLLAALAYVVFFRPTSGIVLYPLAFATLPLLMAPAIRFGPRGATVATALLTLIVLLATARGVGPFAVHPVSQRVGLLQAFLLLMTVTPLALGALITEREAAMTELHRSEAVNRSLLDAVPDLMYQIRRDGTYLGFRGPADTPTVRPPREMIGTRVADYLPPLEAAKVLELIGRALDNDRPEVYEYEVEISGRSHSREARYVPIGPDQVLAIVRDVSDRKKAERILADEHRVLEALATGASLETALDLIARSIERASPGALCSILLLDEEGLHLRHGAAPSLPAGYTGAIDGAAIGPAAGSCGTAAHRGEQVIVTDIATDPLWADYRTVALPYGLRACWSTPIRSNAGRILGTFAVYYRETRGPSPEEQDLVGRGTHLAGIAIDRHRSETALRESRELLESINRNLAEGLFRSIPTSGLIYVNRAFVRMFGYDSMEEMRGAPSARLYQDPVTRDRLLAEIERTGAVTNAEVLFRRKDGSTFWGLVSGTGVRDSSGKIEYYDGAVVDISERKAVEEALRLSEERYRSLVTASAQIIWRTDATGVEWSGTQEWTDLTGQTEAEQAGWGWLDALHPADREHTRARWLHCLATGEQYEAQFRVRMRDGSYRQIASRGIPIRNADGSVREWVGAHTDITERKRAEEALKENERKYRDLVETSQDLIWSVDAEGRWTFVNREAARRIYGYEPEEMLGRPFTDFLTPEQARLDMETFREILAGAPRFQYETVHRRKDGSPINLSFNAIVLRDEQGKVLGTTGTATDITGRRRLEEELRQSQRVEAVGKLAGGIAHDFNNLLTAILGCVELLLPALPEGGTARADAEEIGRAARRAASLTQQLLAFSRRQVLAPRVIDLHDVVGRMSGMLHRLIGEDVQLVIPPATEPVMVKADPGQIEQVVLNLALNARDAMPEGGTLTIETRAVVLAPDFVRQHVGASTGPHVELLVRDTGAGMDPATLSRVFDPFFTTKEPGKGTGLGLSTVYGIVKQSGGYITMESEPGRGTTARVLLPRTLEPATSEPAVRSMVTAERSGTVLLVEDEASVRNLVGRALTRAGYTVLAASNGAEAMQIAGEPGERIDLLLTDVIMPGMSGRQLADTLVALRPGLRVLFVSGYTEDAISHHGVLDHGVAYLQKPFTPDRLVSKVEEVLRGSRG